MSPIHHLPPDPSADQIENYLNGRFKLSTTIVIDTGNIIGNPDPLASLRAGPVAWIVYNRDSAQHTVTIDPASFKIKQTGAYENPLVGHSALHVSLQHGEYGVLVGIIKGNAQFETYKYTIVS